MDTIVAISTAIGAGAISIIRLSGPDAIEIVNKSFKGKDLKKVKSHTITYGYIYDGENCLDEVLVSVFLAPKTYTRENVVEINCHGGMFVTNRILELMLNNGARIAEAGEFTKRAFLNGRIDLTKAEAIMDVINSQTERNLKLANTALRGDVYKLIEGFRDDILNCIAKIEVNIDYPEYEDEIVITNEILKPNLLNLKIKLEDILNKANTSSIIRQGISTAIVGKPNVGKSSLLNALLRENKAIVTNIAGTTRDTIEGKVNLGGVILNLIDTAGVRDTEDVVEKIGVNKSKEVIKDAELVILVLDNSRALDEEDIKLLNITNDKKRIIVMNKNDLESVNNYKGTYINISTFNMDDINQLEKEIIKVCAINEINDLDATYIGNARQISKIKESLNAINEALNGIDFGYPIDIINIDITKAWTALGEIVGKVSSDDLINKLFTNFCLGK